jgi:hypothetical protein
MYSEARCTTTLPRVTQALPNCLPASWIPQIHTPERPSSRTPDHRVGYSLAATCDPAYPRAVGSPNAMS